MPRFIRNIAKKEKPLSQGLFSFVKPSYEPPKPKLLDIKPPEPKKVNLPKQEMLPGLTEVQENIGQQHHTHAWVAYRRGDITRQQYQDIITGVKAQEVSRLFEKIRKRLGFGRDKTAAVKKKKSRDLAQLLQAKQYSDDKNFKAKYDILEAMMAKTPEKFRVDSRLNDKFVGVTHIPTNFKIHVPSMLVPINVEKHAMLLRSALSPSDR